MPVDGLGVGGVVGTVDDCRDLMHINVHRTNTKAAF
jgi:hypothetical protein